MVRVAGELFSGDAGWDEVVGDGFAVVTVAVGFAGFAWGKRRRDGFLGAWPVDDAWRK